MDKQRLKEKILEHLVGYFGKDEVYDIFGLDLNEMMKNAHFNYIKDSKTDWEKVDCVQSLDFMSIVVFALLEELKEE